MKRLHFRPLRLRLLRSLLWLALLCGGLAICGQTWLVYQQESARFEASVEDIGRTHLPLLAVGLWDLEIEALEQQVAQIAARREVAAVELDSATGLHISSATQALGSEVDAVLPIHHARSSGELLGELRIRADRSELDQAILLAAGQKILEIAFYTGLISLLIGYRLHRELDLPLKRIAAYVARLSPEQPAPPPPLHRPRNGWYDEMDLVSRGFETLHAGLLRHGRERDQAMLELAAERDRLDARVAQRTQALGRIAGYQAILSRTLMRCLHLQAAGFPQALQEALESLRAFLPATGLCLAEREAGQPWQLRCAVGLGEAELAGLAPAGAGWSWPAGIPDGLAYVQQEDGAAGQLLLIAGMPAAAEEERRYLQMSAEMLFSLLERWRSAQDLETTRAELERLSLSDPLTGLANRRRFEQARQQECARALRHGQPLALLMLDVDHFKAYNDHYGHAAGDDCLVRIAGLIAAQFQRAGELPVRLGGEEFAVLLPGCDLQQARVAAERVRAAIEAQRMAHAAAPLGHVSVSLGYAAWSAEQTLDFDQLLDCADRSLYLAKAAGRNQVRGDAL